MRQRGNLPRLNVARKASADADGPPLTGAGGPSDVADWPLSSVLTLGSLAGAVPCARLHTRAVLAEWSLSRATSADAETIVSELVTNAVTASPPSAPVCLWLASDGERIAIMVGDHSSEAPRRVAPDGFAEGGRGLVIVEALSQRCGWYPCAGGGKIVWSVL